MPKRRASPELDGTDYPIITTLNRDDTRARVTRIPTIAASREVHWEWENNDLDALIARLRRTVPDAGVCPGGPQHRDRGAADL